MSALRLGLIGAGAIGSAYADALAVSRDVTITAVADPRPEAAGRIASAEDCSRFDDHTALLDGCDVDAVLIATPPATHAAITLDALARGVHVLCEKPLSISLDDAVAMVDRADNSGVLLTMASKFRYVDDVVRAKRIVDSGVLGEIILFENAFTSRVDMTGRWNAERSISGGGVLIDNGTHSVDIARYFLGRITNVMAVEGKRAQELPVEDTAQMFLRSESGIMGTVDLSWSLNKDRPTYIEVYGTQGTIRVGWKGSAYRQAGHTEWVGFGSGYDKLGALRAQIENFCGAIRGDEPLLITATDALASVEVIEAAYASLADNYWMPVRNGNGLPITAGRLRETG